MTGNTVIPYDKWHSVAVRWNSINSYTLPLPLTFQLYPISFELNSYTTFLPVILMPFFRPSDQVRAMGRHLPYGITQCYLLPDTSERAPPRFTYLGGMEGWVDLGDLTAPQPGVPVTKCTVNYLCRFSQPAGIHATVSDASKAVERVWFTGRKTTKRQIRRC